MTHRGMLFWHTRPKGLGRARVGWAHVGLKMIWPLSIIMRALTSERNPALLRRPVPA